MVMFKPENIFLSRAAIKLIVKATVKNLYFYSISFKTFNVIFLPNIKKSILILTKKM